MTNKEIRELSNEEILSKIEESKEELFIKEYDNIEDLVMKHLTYHRAIKSFEFNFIASIHDSTNSLFTYLFN